MSKHGNNRVATSLQRGRVGNGSSNGKEMIFADGKLHWSIAFVPMLTVFLCVWYSLVCFPYTQSMMEQLNFYVNTSEFVGSKLAESPGLNGLLSSWLLQFFHNSNVGAAIEAMLLSLVCLLASLVPVAWHNTVYGLTRKASGPLVLLAAIPAMGLLLFFMHKVELYLEAVCFFGLLCLAGLAARSRVRPLFFVVVTFMGGVSFGMMSFPLTVLLMVLLAVFVFIADRKMGAPCGGGVFMRYSRTVIPLLLVGVVAAFTEYSSTSWSFIPVERRWWHIAGCDDMVLLALSLMLIPMLLMFVPHVRKVRRQITLEVLACVVLGVCCRYGIVGNEEYQTSEKVYRYADYAENGKWQNLLDEIQGNGDNTNVFFMQCALLAEAKLGTLSDNLFSYPINTPELFCPRYENKPYSIDFCRVFYKELGVYDEAFHQAFEYGMKVSATSGFCFASMRHMTEYAVRQGDRRLAEKYLSLLEKTSCHADFVARQRGLLKSRYEGKEQLRGTDFIRSSSFNSEMAHLLDYDKDNRLVLDYLLCGLLLTKNLEIFKTVLTDFPDYFKKTTLPKAYAEAAAMINHLKPGVLGDVIRYSSDYDRQFEQFLSLHNSKQDDSAFQGTFWYYYVYAEIPSLSDWQNYRHSAAS